MNKDEILIVKPPYHLSNKFVKDIHDQLMKQKESGVIILPCNWSVEVAPSDVKIKYEGETDPGTPFDSQGKERLENRNVVEIPDDATNGDALKTLFPYHSLIFNHDEDYVVFIIERSMCCKFTLDWWNAPYQKGGE